jgi:hypothetical protein
MCSRYLLVTTSTFNFVFHGAQEHPIVFKQLPFYIKDQGTDFGTSYFLYFDSHFGATSKNWQGEDESRCRLFKRMV